tara:strand:- start:491 stop:775 length:285 start_codon:yes stop_codon:yes gene_type:complete
MTKEELRQELAILSHHVWIEWWKHQRAFSQKTINKYLLIDGKKVEEWTKRSYASFDKLSERERKINNEIAGRYMALLEEYLGAPDESKEEVRVL